MFRTFTCPSSGVLIYKVVSLPRVVLCPRCCGCGPTELVCSHVHCLSVSLVYENKIIVKLFASSWYISLLINMMHGHTYIKNSRKTSNNKEQTPMSQFILTKMYTQGQ